MHYSDLLTAEAKKYSKVAEGRTSSWADVPRQSLLPFVVSGLVSRGLPGLPEGKFQQSKLNVANELVPADVKKAYRTRAGNLLTLLFFSLHCYFFLHVILIENS